jgi:hypothetical protein
MSALVCAAYGVDDEEDLPKEVQNIDVVKFAEMSPSAISATIVRFSRASRQFLPVLQSHLTRPFSSTLLAAAVGP